MSHAYYEEPVECPECGYSTNELVEAISKHSNEKVLMCEGCYADTCEGIEDWDMAWDGEWDEEKD